MFEAIKKYAVFSGRARRKEYWLFILLYAILGFIANVAGTIFGINYKMTGGIGVIIIPILPIILVFLLLLPGVGVGIRRLHDTDRSGWWLLIVLVPFIGPIWLLVLTVLDGTIGENRFGADPKGRDGSAIESSPAESQ